MAFFTEYKCKMQNRQAGTRGLSAGDWTRIKRIQRATPATSSTNQDIQVSIPGNAPPTNSAGATAFVLACIDPRYASALEAYLSEELSQPGFFTYDLFILAGASLGGTLTGPGTPNGPPNTNHLCAVVSPSPSNNWRSTLLDHIQAAITLHNVTTFYVIDHLDCGAFKVCDNAGDDLIPGPHFFQYNALKAIIDAELFYPNGGGAKVAGSIIFPSWNGLYFDIPVNSLTSLRDYANNILQVEPFPPNQTAKVLVLGCIDPRFNAALTSFLVNYKEVQFIYDLFILAGSSLGVNQSYNTDGTLRANATTGTAYLNNAIAENPGRSGVGPLGLHWGPTFFDHLSIARLLHQITDVWVFDHLDCGAYKLIKLNDGTTPLVLPSDTDPTPHIAEIRKLQARINAYTSTTDYLNNAPTTLGFKGFVMDMSGNITEVVNSNPTPSGPLVFGSSRIRNPASDYTDIVARRSADFVTQSQRPGSLTPLLTVTRLCSCTPITLNTRLGNCAFCKNGIL
jgi:carbonic anhydrase